MNVPRGDDDGDGQGQRQIRTAWVTLDGRRVRLLIWSPPADRQHDASGASGATGGPGNGLKGHGPPASPLSPLSPPLPLLLIHGLGCSAETWLPTLRRVAVTCPPGHDRQIYAVDLPGSGHSPGPRHAPGVEELADWTARLMDLLGVPRAHLVGNSLGCQVALAVARRHPGRAASLVLGGATTGGDLVSLWRMISGLALDGLREPGLYDGSLARMYLQTGPRRYLVTAAKMRADHPVREASAVVVPCLVVRGTRDAAVPEWAARTLADALPRGSFVAVKGSPHALQYAAPEPFSDLALAFCECVDSAGSAKAMDVGTGPVLMGSGATFRPRVPAAIRRRLPSAPLEVPVMLILAGTAGAAAGVWFARQHHHRRRRNTER